MHKCVLTIFRDGLHQKATVPNYAEANVRQALAGMLLCEPDELKYLAGCLPYSLWYWGKEPINVHHMDVPDVPTQKKRYVIAIGNAFDGLELYGPFDTRTEASDAADQKFDGQEYVVVELHPTTQE